MTPRERLVAALNGDTPDHLPATTHHVMEYFLNTYMDGIDNAAFFAHFGLDPILWHSPLIPNAAEGEYWNDELGMIVSDTWRAERIMLKETPYPVYQCSFHTPKGSLSTIIEYDEHTQWQKEHLIKDKKDIEIFGEFCTKPVYDVADINTASETIGSTSLLRGTLGYCSEFFGQPGCWQDAACMVGIERLIMEAMLDPEWVHAFLAILRDRKIPVVQSLQGAEFDVLELGGGDASSTVISPQIFQDFVAPYDAPLIAAAHEAGQRVAYHTCGGMMPILEDIVAMQPDAIETMTPPGMGGDVDLAEAKRRVGDKACFIGGFDQFHFFKDCDPAETRREVRRCFEAAGEGGGFILAPSDHFFDADLPCIQAFADEALACTY